MERNGYAPSPASSSSTRPIVSANKPGQKNAKQAAKKRRAVSPSSSAKRSSTSSKRPEEDVHRSAQKAAFDSREMAAAEKAFQAAYSQQLAAGGPHSIPTYLPNIRIPQLTVGDVIKYAEVNKCEIRIS